MGIDVQYLIDEWERIHDMMAPSPNFFPQFSAVDREIAELSLVSSRREYWQVFVCLMGYSQKIKENPNKVLVGIPFKQIWSGEIAEPWELDPFLRYCSIDPGFKTVPREIFLPAIYIVTLVLARGTLVITPEITERFQECLRLHDHNWPEVWKCLQG